MKTKYYVSLDSNSFPGSFWMRKNGVDYFHGKTVQYSILPGTNWKDLIKKKVIREVKIEELPFL